MLEIDQLVPWEHTLGKTTLRGFYSPPSGKPVIHFLHGNGFAGLVYWPFLKYLTSDYDLFIGSVQGQGDSQTEEPFWGWNRHAFKVAETWTHFKHLWPEVPHIAIGHSFGGVVSSLMLGDKRVSTNFPLHFERLIALDPVYVLPHMIGVMSLSDFLGFGSVNRLAKITLKRTKNWPDRQTALASLSGKGMYKTWSQDAMQHFVDYAIKDIGDGVALKCDPEMESAVFASYPKRLWRSLREIEVPFSMLYGDRTYPFLNQAARKLLRTNADAKVLKVPGSHCFMLDYPEETAKLVLECLKAK